MQSGAAIKRAQPAATDEVFRRARAGSAGQTFLDRADPLPYIARLSRGAIAQLGERLHGMQEVAGSIPASSTKFF